MEIVSRPSLFDNMGNCKVFHENKVDFVQPHCAHRLIEFERHLGKQIYFGEQVYDLGSFYLIPIQAWI